MTATRASLFTVSSTTASQPQALPAAMPPILEQTLVTLSAHHSVLGYLLIVRGKHAQHQQTSSILRRSGVIFEGEQGRKYANAVAKIVQIVEGGLEELGKDDYLLGEKDLDELKFMRIRTKKHELMIIPDDRYLLAVLHDPATP